tara:strand:- start:2425 stop:2787 length:363 start_codon:yes stop_codon:yes gene_type:complete
MTDTTWLLIPADIDRDVSILHEGKDADDITLKQLQTAVGGLIEYARHELSDRNTEIIVNEEGLMLGLLPNVRAVVASCIQQMLVGDAVLQVPKAHAPSHLRAMGEITAFVREKLQEMEEE